MKDRHPSAVYFERVFLPGLLSVTLMVSCSAPVPRPTGVAYEYDSAKDMFKKGRFDRALEFSDGPAKASPPNEFTERARVLQVAIYSGMINAYKDLADAYTQGSEKTKNPRFQGEFGRLRHDYLQYGSRAALGLGEVAHQLTEGEIVSKEFTLDAPFPSAEGPVEVAQLNRVMEGGWIEPEDQEVAAIDAQRKGINDALAGLVGGDRSKARASLTAGPVKIDGVDFALFLGRQLVIGASLFDRKHIRDPQKLSVLCNEADEAANAALKLLKENPDKDKEKATKKLQDDVKAAIKRL
ncbi:MAG: hypothetical protein HYS61_00785 [Acidobacteria bacterium]|nr:hypothetical protein [Acidobacteriota bacterium]